VAEEAAERLDMQGVSCAVVNARWIKPVDPRITEWARSHHVVVTVEDNGRVGGVGSEVMAQLAAAGVDVPVLVCAIPQEFPEPGDRGQVLDDCGLTPQQLTRRIVEAHARVAGGVLDPQVATSSSGLPDDFA